MTENREKRQKKEWVGQVFLARGKCYWAKPTLPPSLRALGLSDPGGTLATVKKGPPPPPTPARTRSLPHPLAAARRQDKQGLPLVWRNADGYLFGGGTDMRIAIIGPGALGCLLAARFSEAGQHVMLVDYRPQRAATLVQQGLTVHLPDGTLTRVMVPVVLPPHLAPVDLAILAVKAYRTQEAAKLLPQLLAEGGLALTLQNGLGNLEAMAAEAGWERLVAGVSFLGATRSAEGEVVFAGAGPTFIGTPSHSTVAPQAVEEVAAAFRQAGLECRVRDDIEAMLWEKLVVNVGINPLTALLRVPNGALPKVAAAWEAAVAAAREACQVASASGIRLTLDPEARLRQVCEATARNRSSMLQDVLAGRETEIGALNGEVARRGLALGVPTPVNRLLTLLLQALTQSHPWQVGQK